MAEPTKERSRPFVVPQFTLKDYSSFFTAGKSLDLLLILAACLDVTLLGALCCT